MQRDYELLEFKEGEGVEGFSLCLTTLVMQLKELGQKMEEVDVIAKFLRRSTEVNLAGEVHLDLGRPEHPHYGGP